MTWEQEVQRITEMRQAPPGKFRVLGVDSFANPPFGDPYVLADCTDKNAAIKLATAHGSAMNPAYVYDSNGKYIFGAGKA